MPEKSSLPNIGRSNTIIYGCIVGSHAYGTNVEGSDIDKKWVYVQSAESFFLDGYKPQIEISKDEVAYELSRFLELCEKANPTILEMLFSPEDMILCKHSAFDSIIRMRKSFLTKACRHSFSGYAISQIEKAKGLDKKMNWEKEKTERKSILDFCYFIDTEYTIHNHESPAYRSVLIKDRFMDGQIKMMGISSIPHTRDLYNVFHDSKYKFTGFVKDEETSNDLTLSEIPKGAYCIGMMYFNKDAYSQHCKAYREYQDWLKNRNTQRYVDVEGHGQKIDGKNMLHCIRLIETALDIAEFGELIVRRTNAGYLKEIRQGKVDLETILDYASWKVHDINTAFAESSLPDKFHERTYLRSINAGIRRLISLTQKSEVFDN